MRASRVPRALLAVVSVTVAVGAMWWLRSAVNPPAPVPPLRGANLLLVTIDTLRADRLGTYGSRAGLTPALDALAARGVRFTRTWSHVPITLPAHTSILTGLLPPHHGVRNNGAFRLGEGPATLAELLHGAGYRTGAFVGAFVLDARFGLNRGFDVYDDRYGAAASPASFHFVERPADQVLQPATTWIAQPASGDARPWFAWVHLFDPHAPYHAPAGFARGRAPYDGEVAWTDSALGKALADLHSRGQLDRTVIVVTADHGESLGDHGETTHGLFAYDSTLRVPLIFVVPGFAAREVSTPAAHVDILPTLLDLLALPARGGLDGRSMRDEIEGKASAGGRPIYFETLDANLTRGWAPLRGIIEGSWKYIELPEAELYNLDVDPSETTNVIGGEASRAEELQARLRDWTAAAILAGSRPDATTAAKLQSLGYASGSAPLRASYTAADDPKRLASLNERFNTALEDFEAKRHTEALDAFRRLLHERPDFITARTSAATVLIATGRAPEAVELLRAAPGNQASSSEVLARLGSALRETGDLAGAAGAFERAQAAGDQNPELLNDLGVVYARLGRTDQARSLFRQLLAIDANAATVWNNLGALELSAHRTEAAADAFRHAVADDPSLGDAWQGLGAALVERDSSGAIEAWRRAERLLPRDYDLLFNLGMVLADSGRPTEAIPYLDRFVKEAPRDRYGRDIAQVEARLRSIKP